MGVFENEIVLKWLEVFEMDCVYSKWLEKICVC